MARAGEGRAGAFLTTVPRAGRAALLFRRPPTQHSHPSPRALRSRATGGAPAARADTLVKHEALGAPSPPTVHLTLLQTLKLPAGLQLNFRPPTSLYAEL